MISHAFSVLGGPAQLPQGSCQKIVDELPLASNIAEGRVKEVPNYNGTHLHLQKLHAIHAQTVSQSYPRQKSRQNFRNT